MSQNRCHHAIPRQNLRLERSSYTIFRIAHVAYALFKKYKESTLTAEQALTKQEELLEKYKA